MLEYACQRIYRDARITSIYEGTTQLQVVAGIRYVTNGSYLAQCREMEAQPVSEAMKPLQERSAKMADMLEEATARAKEAGNQDYLDLCARHLYEMAGYSIMGHLLQYNAPQQPELFEKSARVFMNYADAEVRKHYHYIMHLTPADVEDYRK